MKFYENWPPQKMKSWLRPWIQLVGQQPHVISKAVLWKQNETTKIQTFACCKNKSFELPKHYNYRVCFSVHKFCSFTSGIHCISFTAMRHVTFYIALWCWLTFSHMIISSWLNVLHATFFAPWSCSATINTRYQSVVYFYKLPN